MYSCTRKGTIVDLQVPCMKDIKDDFNTLQKNEKYMRAANVVRALCWVLCFVLGVARCVQYCFLFIYLFVR